MSKTKLNIYNIHIQSSLIWRFLMRNNLFLMLMLIIISIVTTPSYSKSMANVNIIYADDAEKPSDEEPDCE